MTASMSYFYLYVYINALNSGLFDRFVDVLLTQYTSRLPSRLKKGKTAKIAVLYMNDGHVKTRLVDRIFVFQGYIRA
jgi:hypothetical protein